MDFMVTGRIAIVWRENIEGEEGDQQEAFDGVGVMPIDVVGESHFY